MPAPCAKGLFAEETNPASTVSTARSEVRFVPRVVALSRTHSLPQETSAGRNLITLFRTVNNLARFFFRPRRRPGRAPSASTADAIGRGHARRSQSDVAIIVFTQTALFKGFAKTIHWCSAMSTRALARCRRCDRRAPSRGRERGPVRQVHRRRPVSRRTSRFARKCANFSGACDLASPRRRRRGRRIVDRHASTASYDAYSTSGDAHRGGVEALHARTCECTPTQCSASCASRRDAKRRGARASTNRGACDRTRRTIMRSQRARTAQKETGRTGRPDGSVVHARPLSLAAPLRSGEA